MSRILGGKGAHESKEGRAGLIGIPCILYRGGTSKGPAFLASDLPSDLARRDAFLLAVLNPQHPGQIDGIGGHETLSNKVVIVSPSKRSNADVDYQFIQLTPGSCVVSSNCGTSGNMASVVGPFALECGLVRAASDETDVRIFAVDSDMRMTATVQSPGGQLTYAGSYRIDGVSGTGAPVRMAYHPPFGNLTATGRPTPTGNRCDIVKGVPVSVIDAGGEVSMIFRADAVGKTGYESKSELDVDESFAERIEDVRQEVGRLLGMGDVSGRTTPATIMVALPRREGTITSRKLATLAGAPARCHAAHSGSGGICLAIASILRGTVAFEVARPPSAQDSCDVVIEHPSGTMTLGVEMTETGNDESIAGVSLLRTCRKLFSGQVYAPLDAPPDVAAR